MGRVRRARVRARWCLLVALVSAPANTRAQVAQAPPGPYVIDVRGATMTLPEDTGFYPPLPETALVPARGFGLDAGGHVYFGQAGPARLGAGASVAFVRGTTADGAALSGWVVAPQLSFNFGTADGWSYLSAGVGAAGTRGEFTPAGAGETATRRSNTLLALNAGGGARWFFTDHLAVGFDLRLHRVGGQDAQVGLAGTPSSLQFLASVGLSMK